ncbi:OB-fold-containig protein [Blastomonas sp.]|uniref:OB-fold-containig protein n=1 Tax=Blastomonas sp. TaxID=1909299 RepID=UPI00391C914E
MLDFFLAIQNTPFAAAIVLMLLIGGLQAAGLGDLDADSNLGDAAGDGLLALLGLGRLPLLLWLALLLMVFGVIGYAGQQFWQSLTGSLASAWLAGPVAFAAALPITSAGSRLLARVMPQDETTAVAVDSLVGRFATIQTGTARPGSPARARVTDIHGHPHFVMVEPDNADQTLHEGEEILLVRREGETFRAVSRGGHFLPGL